MEKIENHFEVFEGSFPVFPIWQVGLVILLMVLLFQVHRKQSSCTIQIRRKQVEEIVKNTSGEATRMCVKIKLWVNSVNLKKSLVK